MAITSNRYDGDGTTTRFAVTFAQYSWTSIVVYLDQVEQTTGYVYDSTTKEIVFTTAPNSGAKITIKRLTDAELLYKFGEGAAFTGANIDSNFEQYQTAVEEVQNAADSDFVTDALESEIAARQEADASLQSQITAATPILANEMSVVTWHGQTLTNSVDVPAHMNAFSVGPQIAIAPGQSVNLGEGSVWNILGNAFEVDELYNVTANNLTTSDGSFTIAVDNIAALDVQTAHGTAISTNASAIAALTTRMTNEEGKTQPITLGGTGANDADGALTSLGGGTTGIAVFKGATAAAVRSTLAAAALASPTFTGVPAAPTAAAGTNTTQLATTEFVTSAVSTASTILKAGVTNGSSAAAGVIGEVLSATGTAANATTAVARNLVSLTLTPGDWEVTGVGYFLPSASSAITTVSLGTSSGVIEVFPNRTRPAGATTIYESDVPVRRRFNVSATTTIYLVGYVEFSSGTVSTNGYIEARRMR